MFFFFLTKVEHVFELLVFVISYSIFMRLEGAAAQNEACNRVTRCGSTEIRFPFHLKERDKQHKEDHCVFPPGFQLSCEYVYQEFFIPKLEFKYQVNTSHSGLYLSLSVNASVVSINYRSQQLLFVLDSPEYGRDIRQHYYSRNSHHYNYNNLPKYPFKPFTLTDTPSTNSELHDLEVGIYSNYTFYNCSITKDIVGENAGGNILIWSVPSLGGRGYEVYAVYSPLETILYPMTSCTKMYNVSNVPYNAGGLSWSGPNCGDCEAKGQYCKFKPNSTILTQCHTKGKVVGISMVLVTLVVLYYATKSYKQKKKHLLKIEVFLEDYKALKPSRYSYADIRKISNNFNVKLGEGGYGSVYKGQLSNDVFVAIKVLNDKVDDKRSGEDFINELCTTGQSMVSMTMARGTIGYIAPEVFSRNFGKVSSKSDVYSFGMLLLEMVGARDHTSAGTENTSEAYFPEWVFHQLEQGRETRSQIEEEVNNNIAKKLTIVGLWCINWHPGDRPSMKHVIQMLQEEDCPAIPPNPFSSASEKTASMFSNMLDAISESD
ncbi:hypothetical protein DCAR_0831935 [Daucus carota subsp. sativus]|uniref:Protein kinase domain-containing protein n=1 Tax=Daucus carota subsp. sativus TaxID=79200 RepID=A0AAF0XQK0_DAUCS|nr:hypothetical protein DCAR_0831935 [Daucus carota subsp. sativus]